MTSAVRLSVRCFLEFPESFWPYRHLIHLYPPIYTAIVRDEDGRLLGWVPGGVAESFFFFFFSVSNVGLE